MPATPTRTWNWWSSCSELRISLPRITFPGICLNGLLALGAPLRQEKEPGDGRPQDRADKGADEDRPSRERVARAEPHDHHRRLGGEQDEGNVQRLQHGSEPQDTPR